MFIYSEDIVLETYTFYMNSSNTKNILFITWSIFIISLPLVTYKL